MLYKIFSSSEGRPRTLRLLNSDRFQDRETAVTENFAEGFFWGVIMGIIAAAIWVANSPAPDL
jgi:hypothetical protein